MRSDRRFVVIHSEGSELTQCSKILVDRETGITYLFIKSGYSGGLTVLLDKEGKPVITDVSRY